MWSSLLTQSAKVLAWLGQCTLQTVGEVELQSARTIAASELRMTSKRKKEPRQVLDGIRESAKQAGATPIKLKIRTQKSPSSQGKGKI